MSELVQADHAQLVAHIAAQTALTTAKAVTDAAQAAAKVLAAENGLVVTAIALLRADVVLLKSQVVDIGIKFEKVSDKLNEVAIGRPTWAVALILGALTSIVVGLTVFVSTKI